MMNEPADVEAVFDEAGAVRVVSFWWKDRRWPVFSQGRQWDAPDGRRHTLVMTSRERVYELAHDRAAARWFVVMASEDQLAA